MENNKRKREDKKKTLINTTQMTSRNYSVEQSNVSYKIDEILFTKSLTSETKCNQKVLIAIKVIKAGLRKLK